MIDAAGLALRGAITNGQKAHQEDHKEAAEQGQGYWLKV
jgi:hypothetical protein